MRMEQGFIKYTNEIILKNNLCIQIFGKPF